MKAIILAAGRGTRISRYLSGNPKCTVDLVNKKLIQYTVDLLKSRGVDDISIVVGYNQNAIREVLKDRTVKFYDNPFYDVTNSIASLWFARKELAGSDILIMNGDVFMEADILDDLLRCAAAPVMLADESRKESADYKFYYENNILLKYGKELTGSDITGEYVGIAKISSDFLPVFVKKMDELINTQQHSFWWENILYSLIPSSPVYVHDVGGKFWAEVDYVEDYERIKEFVKNDKDNLY